MPENANEKNAGRRSIARARTLSIIVAFAAMLMSFFTLVYVFGSDVIDMGNMCYYIYVDAPGHDDEAFLKAIRPMMREAGLNGWTVRRNVLGAYMGDDGEYVFENESYQLIMAAASKQSVEALGRMMLDKFEQNTVLIEEVLANATFLENASHFRRLRRDDAIEMTGFASLWRGFAKILSPNF